MHVTKSYVVIIVDQVFFLPYKVNYGVLVCIYLAMQGRTNGTCMLVRDGVHEVASTRQHLLGHLHVHAVALGSLLCAALLHFVLNHPQAWLYE
jgi:hypothetical protein